MRNNASSFFEQGERERPLLRTIAKHAKNGGQADGEEGAVTALASAGMQARSIPPAVVDHFVGAPYLDDGLSARAVILIL